MTPRTKKPKPSTDKIPRVVRGGSWHYATATNVRAALRDVSTPMGRYFSYIGFRTTQAGCRQILKGGAKS